MNIERTTKVTLSLTEVATAIQDYIHTQHRYRYDADALKSYEGIIAIEPELPSELTVIWGKPLVEETATEITPVQDEEIKSVEAI